MRWTLLTFCLTTAVATAGCGGDSDNEQPPPTTSTGATTAPPADTSPSPSPPPEPTYTLGDEQESNSGGQVTGLDYQQPVAEDSPQPVDAGYPEGYQWAGLDVKVCVPDSPPPSGSDGYYITTTVWKLAFPDGSLVDTSHTGYQGFPQPEYPWGDTEVALGQCIRGWLVFPVPSDDQPSGVHYTGGNGVLQWKLSEG